MANNNNNSLLPSVLPTQGEPIQSFSEEADALLDSFLEDYLGIPFETDKMLDDFLEAEEEAQQPTMTADMRGKHNAGRSRASNRERDPYVSVFYTNYLEVADDTSNFQDKAVVVSSVVRSGSEK